MHIEMISLFPGTTKDGLREPFDRLDLPAGEIVSIVGPTGSGKTAFITDIELLAQGDTATGRHVLINGRTPPDDLRYDPALKPVAMITQNTKCFTDLSVGDFIAVHTRARGLASSPSAAGLVESTIDLANKFTGEKIAAGMRVTTLSGGQTRALMIADALKISAAPVILLDEIENAGIFKQEVVHLIRGAGKIIIYVTHDPVIAILAHTRVVLANGGVLKVLRSDGSEQDAADSLMAIDRRLVAVRERLRAGETLCGVEV